MKKIGSVIFLSVLSIVVYAQEIVSLEDCRRWAIENNKKLKMADEQIRVAREKKAEAFTKYLPGVDAMGTYLRNQKKINLLEEDALLPVLQFDPQEKTYKPKILGTGPGGKPIYDQVAFLPKEEMSVDDRNTAVLQVGLTQPIYMGGKIRAYNEMAGLSEKLAQSGKEEELQNIIQETDEAYWQIISLVNRQKLAEKYVETLRKFEYNVEMTYKVGMATKADVLSVKVRLNQAEMTLTKVGNGLSLSRMSLNQICGLPLDTVFPLQEEMIDRVAVSEVPALDVEQIYHNRPEIGRLTVATDIYKQKEKIARSEYLPTIAFMANYMAMTPSFFNGISTKIDGMWSVGVGIKAPVFHWGASRKSVRSARAETSMMNYKLQEAKEKIELQVKQAQFKIKEAAKKLTMAQKDREKADENLKYADLGFQEGTIPVSNVLEAQTAWLAAQAEWIDTQIEMRLCEVYLQKAYGVLGR